MSPQGFVSGTSIHNNWLPDTQTAYLSLLHFSAGMSGVYLDVEIGGWEVDQNVLWNNEYDSIFLNASGVGNLSAP